MTGPTQTLLNNHPNSPAAKALDLMVSGMREGLTTLAGDWTPSLLINRAQSLIDAEMRLGTGGDIEGVCKQVGGLMLLALEKLAIG